MMGDGMEKGWMKHGMGTKGAMEARAAEKDMLVRDTVERAMVERDMDIKAEAVSKDTRKDGRARGMASKAVG